MSDKKIDCYIIPSVPLPVILPIECVAEIAAKPVIEPLEEAPSKWMQGHANWHNQRIPVLSYASLQDSEIDESRKTQPHIVVLKPIPNAARKAYSALLCYGEIQQVTVEPGVEAAEIPEGMDRRYVESLVQLGEQTFIIPKLSSLGVAFSYF